MSRSPSIPAPPREERAVELADGRKLGIAEFGDPQGQAILWFHGTPGARRQVPPGARTLAVDRGLRIVGVERPGTGWSTPHLYGEVRDWADDVEELTQRLGIGRFGAVGLSGGGPYLLACAHELPDQMVAGGVLGGVAPSCGKDAPAGGMIRLGVSMGGLIAMLRGPVAALLSTGIRNLRPAVESLLDLYLRACPEHDREVMSRPEMRAMFLDDIHTAAAHGGLRAVPNDILLFTRPWGFSLRDVRVPVHFWQGDADQLVPFSHGTHQAALVPGAGFSLREDEGHLGAFDAAGDAIEFILSQWD